MSTHPCNVLTLHIFVFYTALSLITSSATRLSYSDHCASFGLGPARETLIRSRESSQISFLRHRGYYSTTKPNEIWSSVLLRFLNVYETDSRDLFSVYARLVLGGTSMTYNYGTSDKYFMFKLDGIWSKSEGKLCAVGEGYSEPKGGESKSILVLAKLFNLYDSTNITVLVSGSVESLVGSGFDTISFILFPKLNYEYTLVSPELVDYDSSDVVSPGLPLDSLIGSLCSLIFDKPISLRYAGRCTSSGSAKKCSPSATDLLSRIPDSVTLQRIECFVSPQRLRLLIKFGTDRMLDPKTTTLVGEGIWDAEKNRLFVVACRLLSATESWAEARGGDCSTRLSLWLPSVWKIGDARSITGHIWSTKSKTDLDFFEEIGFDRSDGLMGGAPEMKYEYTMMDKVKTWCPGKNPLKLRERKTYPDALSNDMSFDVLGERSKSEIITGYAEPVFVGDRIYSMRWHVKNFSEPDSSIIADSSLFVSYRISLVNMSSQPNRRFDISAEGIYDAMTGRLCMVGCRNVGSNSSDTLDCDVLVDFQFPPRNSRENGGGFIKGSVESKRKRSDPLHFERFGLSSAAYVSSQARESVWAVNLEIVSTLVSNALACVFVAFQIFHLKKNPDLAPFVSVTMLTTLAVGYTVPPAMDSTSFATRDVLLGSGRWVEAKGVTEGVTAFLLFLFQARLLQLVWSSRLSPENQSMVWTAENEAFLVSLPLYLGGAFLSASFAWSTRNQDISASVTSYAQSPFSKALKSYADVLLDGFLAPQVLLNVFRDSREKSLSHAFYFGTTLVRVLPRAYRFYKARSSVPVPDPDSYWDLIISLGSLLLTSIIYLQHKFGGRCVLCFRLRESNVRDKATNASENK